MCGKIFLSYKVVTDHCMYPIKCQIKQKYITESERFF